MGAGARSAAAEFLGGGQDGAVQAGFAALEAGQDAFRAIGVVACGDFGEATDWVEGAIPRIVVGFGITFFSDCIVTGQGRENEGWRRTSSFGSLTAARRIRLWLAEE